MRCGRPVRRKSLKEAGVAEEMRLRIWRLEEDIKVVRDWASQFGRVRAAEEPIADGQGTAAEQKLVAFWLLQLGQFPAACPTCAAPRMKHWRASAVHLPETAKDLAVAGR